jgi:hypothetical protein
MFPTPHLRVETGPVSEKLSSLIFRIPDDGQRKYPATLTFFFKFESLNPYETYFINTVDAYITKIEFPLYIKT